MFCSIFPHPITGNHHCCCYSFIENLFEIGFTFRRLETTLASQTPSSQFPPKMEPNQTENWLEIQVLQFDLYFFFSLYFPLFSCGSWQRWGKLNKTRFQIRQCLIRKKWRVDTLKEKKSCEKLQSLLCGVIRQCASDPIRATTGKKS